MFPSLFLVLDKGLNRAHVGGNHCCLTIPYFCFWEHVQKHFGNSLGTYGNTIINFYECGGNILGTPKSKNQNCLEILLLNHPQE
jgi:hypothetical protein